MLHTAQVRQQHREAEPDRATHAVVQPDRVPFEVRRGPLLRCREGAGQAGRLAVAAVLSSLYPSSTVLLAALLLGERVIGRQLVGIVAALAAIALIAS